MYSRLLSLSALVLTCSALPRSQIHMALSESEIQSVFDADSHSAVPEYQLVNIRSRTRRSAERGITKQVTLDAFGERYDLNLEKNEGLMADQFDIFYADPAEDGSTSFQRAVEAELLDVGDPYQDRGVADAALLVHHDPDNGALLLDGTVGATLVIRPVPASARPQADREAEANINDLPPDDEFFLDAEENLQDESIIEDGFPLHQHQNSSHRVRRRVHKRDTQGLHFVYHRSTPILKADYGVMELDSMPTGSRRRHRRSAPSVVYPEVLIIIDYDGFLLHEQDNNKIKKYFTSFMNGVDLRYKQLRNPEIKVNIAGMIISRGADATPYLEQNKVTSDSIDSAAALTAMGKYLFEERRLPTYDIAMAITKHDLCRRRNSGKCTKGTAGFAYVGGACVVNKRLTKVNSVAIVEDTGGFSGIIVAAHELGHLLGNVHDGSPPPSYLGGPGAKRCRWEEGFIMSDLRHTEKGFKWSPCSLEEFDHFLNGETATCLYNAPHERNNLDRHLPGKLLSLDAQCKRDRGTSACFKDDRVCAQLFCFDQATGYCVSYRPAAEGSPCGTGKYCRDGYCVTDDSAGNGFGRISYGSSDFFTSATQTRPVWTDPPTQQTTEKAITKKAWNPWSTHRSTREIHGSTETTSTTARTTTTTTITTTTTTTTTAPTTTPTATTTTTTPSTTTRSWWTKRPKNSRWTAWRKPSRSTTTTTTTEAPTTTSRRTTVSTSRRTTTPPPVTAVRKNTVEDNAIKASSKEAAGQCVDRVSRLVGSLSCKQFIQRYGYRYCSRKYVQRNCCASHKRLCTNRGPFSG